MTTLQPTRGSAAPCERALPLTRLLARRRVARLQGRSDLLTVAALVVPAVAAGLFLGRKLFRRGQRSPAARTVRPQVIKERDLSVESLDVLRQHLS